MKSSVDKNEKRKLRLKRDLDSLGFNYPSGVREKLYIHMENKTKKKSLSPFELSKKLLDIAPEYKSKAYLSVLLSILGEIMIFASFLFGAFAAQNIYMVSKGESPQNIFKYAMLTFLALILNLIFTGISSMLSHTTSFHILDRLRKAQFEKLQRISPGYLVLQPVGKIKVNLQEKVQNLEDWVAHLYPELPGKFLHPILATIILFIVNWKIGLSILAPLPVIFFGSMVMMDKYEARIAVFMASYSYLAEKTVEFVRGIPVIKAFLQEDKSFKKYREAAEFYHDTTIDWYKKSWLSMSIVMAAVMSPLIVTLPFAFYLFSKGELQVWELILSLVLPLSILPQAFLLAQSFELFTMSEESVGDIFELLEYPEQQRPEKLSDLNFDRSKGIVFEDVSFSYEEDKEVLHKITFCANTDEITALVGPSGSGKSTIAKLIAGFWDQDSGRILIEGIENKSIPFDDLMKEISYVSQDNFLFDTTIRKNLLIAKPDATEEQMINAAKLASCHEFIMKLPNGYDTKVGELGASLSGGERQRITIARAMLKDANIVVLDEATAYTDPENEALIQQAISKLVKGKTLIVVAHRLHTIENADNIFVIDKGRVEASGTHEELMKDSKLYRRLWKNYMGGESDV